jgi:hypothetical protein
MNETMMHAGRSEIALEILAFRVLALALVLIGSGCDNRESLEDPTGENEIRFVSLVSLIATPYQLDGEKIFVQGFISRGRESDLLYLHEQDADFLIGENAIWLDFSDSPVSDLPINNCYVVVEGRFFAGEITSLLHPPSVIREITRLRPSITSGDKDVENDCAD